MTSTYDQPRFSGVRMPSQRPLFSESFLEERLPTWPEFQELDVEGLFTELNELWQREKAGLRNLNEAQTEERFIRPVLQALGFFYTVQVELRVGQGRRLPDYALFLDDDTRAEADSLGGMERFQRAVAVAEAKRFDRPLAGRGVGESVAEDPEAQIIHYILLTKRRWGILTNGRLWRLYAADGDLIEGACYELDLVALLESGGSGDLRYLLAFFGAQAFVSGEDGACFLDRALDASTSNAVRVGSALQQQIFSAVPKIAQGLLGNEQRTEEALTLAFENALVVLYRLLFCLHAEARDLLPVNNAHYRDYSIRKQKEELARDIDRGRVFSSRSNDLYNDLCALFSMIDRGDGDLDVNEYDGGLFAAAQHSYLDGRSIPDSLLAFALDSVYRVERDFVDYKDLSVRHLGTIYEHLLDYRLEEEGGAVELVSASGRHESGSYFTPERIVDLIVERTLEPVLEAKSKEIAESNPTSEKALEAFLELRLLDPAMGSGHFLVSAAAYISQYIATDPSYTGDLSLLDIQRLVAERCLYGVDLNPLAVELSKLSLWMSTVRRGEPLTFLNNLRVGNSLVGAEVGELLTGGGTLSASALAQQASELLDRLAEIDSLQSHSATQVHRKESLARVAEELRAPLEQHADETIATFFTGGEQGFFHWELEFADAFLDTGGYPREDGGFDAVIGNPPYVRIQELGRELAQYCRRRYGTASGSFDIYVPFVERSLSLLKPDGRLGFILPNKFLKLDYGKRLRAELAGSGLVEEIIDFGDVQLFEAATNYTCILILDKGGQPGFAYRKVAAQSDDSYIRHALNNPDALPAERFGARDLGEAPWVLATGEEARLLRTISAGTERLDRLTQQIFQGLITSADRIYIVEDRGVRGGNRLVYSRASNCELELEPDLLHPLASGIDVGRYAFHPLGDRLLFPYVLDGGEMRLVSSSELADLPKTASYLREHEQMLRGREKGKMDHDGWYGYVYPKSLGAHDLPKLGVPRLCERLRASADPEGLIYLDNVDVNGVLLTEKGISIWTLTALLNSRAVDFVFRRGSVPFRGNFFSANKQFIAPLPIRIPEGHARTEIEELGRRLQRNSLSIGQEKRGFLDWLSDAVGQRVPDLAGHTKITSYDQHTISELLTVLRDNSDKLSIDPGSRAFRDRLDREHAQSLERLNELQAHVTSDEVAADAAVYDLYEIVAADRATIEAEYATDS